jgi:hypothetical protein
LLHFPLKFLLIFSFWFLRLYSLLFLSLWSIILGLSCVPFLGYLTPSCVRFLNYSEEREEFLSYFKEGEETFCSLNVAFPEACWGGACRSGGGILESSVILSNDVADMYNRGSVWE